VRIGLIEIDPNVFCDVIGINPDRDSLAGLCCGLLSGSEFLLCEYHLWFAARDIDFQFDSEPAEPIKISALRER